MIDLAKLTASINENESLRLLPYTDTTGHITIGWGTNLDAGITQAEADYLRDNRILAAVETAQAQPWWPMVQDCDPRARAFIEILFNMGLAKFNEFTKAIAAAMESDWPTCSAELLDSLWARQVSERAETLAAMVLTGSDSKASA
jgi:lysozyme